MYFFIEVLGIKFGSVFSNVMLNDCRFLYIVLDMELEFCFFRIYNLFNI